MRRFLGICLVFNLAILWACTEVEIVIPSHISNLNLPKSGGDPGKPAMSLTDFKKMPKQKLQGSKGRAPMRCDRNGSNLKVHPVEQETTDWCWAATSKMIIDYYGGQARGTALRQCDIVSSSSDPKTEAMDCCPENPDKPSYSSDCMVGGWPSVVFENYGINYVSVNEALDWDSLTNEICSNGPFLYVIDLADGGRHALVVTGYRTTDEPKGIVQIYDPLEEDIVDVSYDEFVGDGSGSNSSNSYGYTHYRDYVQISPKAGGQL